MEYWFVMQTIISLK